MKEKEPQGKFAWMVKMGEKGQIVIPKEAREVFKLKPGNTILLLGDTKRGLAIAHGNKFAEIASQIFGMDTLEDAQEDDDDSD